MQFQNLSDVPQCSEHSSRKAPLRILLLADDRHPANTVQDHINAFKNLSVNRIEVINPIHEIITPPIHSDTHIRLRFSGFDVILIHYSIFILSENYLPHQWRRFIVKFNGFKAQIIQDEYRQINEMKQRMSELGIHAVFSSLGVDALEKVYSGDMLASTQFFSCLPGYIPEETHVLNPPDIRSRSFDIVYRGRTLPPNLGRHAKDKRIIGEQMLAASMQYNLKVDIALDENSRIYGKNWLEFLMSGRATLGVEGGASIFDFDGELEEIVRMYKTIYPDAEFDKVWKELLSKHEGNIVHKTITPKIFEAIASKTALILYPGSYRGMLQAEKHYIPLRPDGYNMLDVVERLQNDIYLQELVDRTYDEVILRPDLSYEFYVNKIDNVLLENAKPSLLKNIRTVVQ